MADNVNPGKVVVTLRDVYGAPVTDEVELKFYNQIASSLNRAVTLKFKGTPLTLEGLPAFPFGRAELFIKPKRYRYKSIFINLFPDTPLALDETLFVDPDGARPTFVNYAVIKHDPN
ncbi:MAG: hypothetical protein ACRD68_07135, partial [Pyrinomonadaceae bacterium]